MNESGILYQALIDRVGELEKRCAALDKELGETIELVCRALKRQDKEVLRGIADHADNIARLTNLENKVFPNLKIDLEHLRRTIGPDGPPYESRLDRKS
jgi:phosphate uptake regulator